MKKNLNKTKDIHITALILSVCFIVCLIIQNFSESSPLIPALFVLCVFLISVITQKYAYGIAASFISVLAVNFAFTFPFFAFNFTPPENILSAVILLIITVITVGLTAQIKTQESIKAESEREKMRANLLRAISHDLRTPLTTIYGASSALLDNYNEFSDAQKRKMINSISEDSAWLSRMVENLLSITRLDGSNVKIIKSDTVIEELVDSILVKFAKRYPGIKVSVKIPDEFVTIPMDALLIEQVALNILENSAQHAKGMTELSLKVFTHGDKAIFEIQDNGCGIPPEQLENIFTGIYSSKTVSDNNKKNAGIGLSVCASIIKAHDGTIRAENSKKGGCIFRFTLNMEESENE